MKRGMKLGKGNTMFDYVLLMLSDLILFLLNELWAQLLVFMDDVNTAHKGYSTIAALTDAIAVNNRLGYRE